MLNLTYQLYKDQTVQTKLQAQDIGHSMRWQVTRQTSIVSLKTFTKLPKLDIGKPHNKPKDDSQHEKTESYYFKELTQ